MLWNLKCSKILNHFKLFTNSLDMMMRQRLSCEECGWWRVFCDIVIINQRLLLLNTMHTIDNCPPLSPTPHTTNKTQSRLWEAEFQWIHARISGSAMLNRIQQMCTINQRLKQSAPVSVYHSNINIYETGKAQVWMQSWFFKFYYIIKKLFGRYDSTFLI